MGHISHALSVATANANICAMCPNYLARGYHELHVKQAKQKVSKTKKMMQLVAAVFNKECLKKSAFSKFDAFLKLN